MRTRWVVAGIFLLIASGALLLHTLLDPDGWTRRQKIQSDLDALHAENERLELHVDYPSAGYTLSWVATARCDEYGLARLYVPYTTEGPNGDGRVRDARWSLGERGGPLVIPEAAVLGGKPIVLR